LALCDVNETNLQKTVEIASAHGVKVYSATVDVSKRDAFQTFADNVSRALGNASVIINNAGVALSQNVEGMDRKTLNGYLTLIFGAWLTAVKPFCRNYANKKMPILSIFRVFLALLVCRHNRLITPVSLPLKALPKHLRQELNG
jgi:short-subunit dehydrogenase